LFWKNFHQYVDGFSVTKEEEELHILYNKASLFTLSNAFLKSIKQTYRHFDTLKGLSIRHFKVKSKTKTKLNAWFHENQKWQ
jgi:hypothetical protein